MMRFDLQRRAARAFAAAQLWDDEAEGREPTEAELRERFEDTLGVFLAMKSEDDAANVAVVNEVANAAFGDERLAAVACDTATAAALRDVTSGVRAVVILYASGDGARQLERAAQAAAATGSRVALVTIR